MIPSAETLKALARILKPLKPQSKAEYLFWHRDLFPWPVKHLILRERGEVWHAYSLSQEGLIYDVIRSVTGSWYCQCPASKTCFHIWLCRMVRYATDETTWEDWDLANFPCCAA